MKKWVDFYTIIPKQDMISGRVNLPEDAKTYTVWDDDYKDTFQAEYNEAFQEHPDIVMNISSWYTTINGKIVKLPNVTKYVTDVDKSEPNNNEWSTLYYHILPGDLQDPEVHNHLPENGETYEVELFDYTEAGNMFFKRTCIARYAEEWKTEGNGQSLVNKSKWYEQLFNGQEKEIEETVLRFREK